jgi:hypothetical protein
VAPAMERVQDLNPTRVVVWPATAHSGAVHMEVGLELLVPREVLTPAAEGVAQAASLAELPIAEAGEPPGATARS